MDRRSMILASGTAAFTLMLGGCGNAKPPRLLVRSLWQWENIGDVAHALGMVALIREVIPEAEIVVWGKDPPPGSEGFVKRALGGVKLMGFADPEDNLNEIERCDYFIGGSGPNFSASGTARRWVDTTGKPFGVFGTTLAKVNPSDISLLAQAEFAYFRESRWLEAAEEEGLDPMRSGYVPDDVFAYRLKDDVPEMVAWMKENDLQPGNYLCFIPRYRYTPSRGKSAVPDQGKRDLRNAKMAGQDHAQMLVAIERIVRETGRKALICAEDEYQVQLGKDALYDALPGDVKRNVVWRDRFWFPDEAATVYRHSLGIVSNDQHSPIIAVAHGVPGLVCHPQSLIWRDAGLEQWLFDLNSPERMKSMPDEAIRLATKPEECAEIARKARNRAHEVQVSRMQVVRKLIEMAR